MEFNDIQKLVFEEYIKNGFLARWTVCPKNVYSKEQRLADIAEVGLFNTEVSEALDDLMKVGYPMLIDKLGNEIADLIIRALNFASRKGIEIEPYILSKNEVNLKREELHGKIF